MGGSIRIIVKHDNKITALTRWTNPVATFVQHIKFLTADSAHIATYLNQKSEYAEPNDDFVLFGYGIIVLDFDAKIIYDFQDYCDLMHVEYAEIALANEERFAEFKELWDKGYMQAYYLIRKEHIEVEYADETGTFEQQVSDMEIDHKRRGPGPGKVKRGLKINWEKAGWTLNCYKNGLESANQLFETIKNNYLLSEKESAGWVNYITECYE
jgi:hypothetical protein